VESIAFTAELANEKVEEKNELCHNGATLLREFTLP